MASAPAQLLRSLAQLHLLEPAQAEELSRGLVGQELTPHALARLLLDRGWLTAYQANQWLQGRGQELLLGSYVLLEKLGEGGMGAVFKARNWKLGQTVALKLIRSERVGSADHVRRFQREIRAAAQLDHPNIVRAFDADEVHGSFALVMEYVDGIDLARLVRQHGPPPVALACEYVRQAALGLQHAFERGLVHRDIKPGNLLLCRQAGTAGPTAAGIVKVLDMGLARLEQSPAGEGSGTLTVEGTIVGTPDYISPEQARHAHQADIRSDLYSLGCSFYFLLTGRPPFTGGSLTEKLLRHQLETPRSVEQLRPDVPEAVATVVSRLMAKDPAERYQTPAELAEHLQALLEEGVALTEYVLARPALAELMEQTEEIQGDSTFWADIVASRNQQTLTLPGIRRKSRWPWFVGAVGAVAALGIALVLLLPGQPEPKPPSREQPEEAATTKPPGQPAELKPSAIWTGTGPRVRWVSFTPDGKSALSGSAEPGVRLWDPTKGQGRSILAQHGRGLGVAPTAEGRLVVGVLEAGGALGFVDLAGEKWIACPALPEKPEIVSGWAAAPASQLAAVAWGTARPEAVAVCDPGTGQLSLQLAGYGNTLGELVFSPDERFLVGAGHKFQVPVWDTRSGKGPRWLDGHTSSVRGVSFAADGRLASLGRDGIRIWDVEQGKQLAHFSLADIGEPSCLRFSPDGRCLALGGKAGWLRLLEPETGAMLAVLTGTGADIASVAFAPDGRNLIAAGDRDIPVWNVSAFSGPAPTGPWQPLFNGEDFEGWSKNFDPDMTFRYQVVKADGGPTFRIEGRGTVKRKELLNNYQLRLEFKWTEPGKETSGAVYHHVIPGGSTSLAFISTGQGRWASYGHNRRADEAEWQQGKLIGRNQAVSPTKFPQGMQKPAGQWNVLEVVCWEATTLYRLNGVQQFAVVNLRRERAGVEEPVTSGGIALGSTGKGFLCRRIQMRSLTEIPPELRQ